MRNESRRELVVAAAVLGVLLIPFVEVVGAQTVEGSFDRVLEVAGPVDLEVNTGSGSITVTTGAADVVRVVGKIRARSGGGMSAEEKVRRLEESPPIDQRGNVIRVGEIMDYDLRRNVSISYELVVPAETSLVSKTGSGSQEIGDIRGPVEATSGSGSLSLGNIGGDVEASAGSGSIRIDTVKGALEVSTGSGTIRAGGVAGAIRSSSGSGSVEIEQTAPGDVDIKTGSGSVRVSGVRGALEVDTGSGSIRAAGEPTGEWHLHASSGGVTLRLPQDVGFELKARTSSGSIESDHPITLVGKLSKRELRGSVRGGGHLLDISTSSGNIRIQ